MKVGAKLSVFNWNLRNRRKELGLTQAELADLAGIHQQTVSKVEVLRHVGGNWPMKLEAICDVLDVDFDELFPRDYIDALTKKGLRQGIAPPIITREIELSKLIEMRQNDGLLTSTIEDDAQIALTSNAITEELERVMAELTPREKLVVKLRYGIGGKPEHTLAETADILGLSSGERIRQIEKNALKKMRHPDLSGRLSSLSRNGY